MQTVLPEARLVYLHESHLPDCGGGLQLMHGVRAPRPTQALHTFGDGTARNQDELLAGLPKLRDLRCPARDGGRVQPCTPVGDEGAADFDDETPCLSHAAFPVSKNFITAKLSSRQPSPVSADMQKIGPRQRSPRTRLAAAVLRSSAGSISILFRTSQRGFRCSPGSNFFSSAATDRASRAGSASGSKGATSTMFRSSRGGGWCLRNWGPKPAPSAA